MFRWCCICILSLAGAGAAHAAGVQVTHERCSGVVTLVADDARLSDVLAELARVLPFKYSVAADGDDRVTLQRTAAPADLIAELMRHRNAIVVQGADRACDDAPMPVRLWVLERTDGTALAATAPMSAATPAAPASGTQDNRAAATPAPPRRVRTSERDDGKQASTGRRRSERSREERYVERMERREARRQRFGRR